MLNLLRERCFVDTYLGEHPEIARLVKDDLEVVLIDHPEYPWQVGCSPGATLALAALGELRNLHRAFLDELDALPDPEDTKRAAPVVARHAARFRALMEVWEVCL